MRLRLALFLALLIPINLYAAGLAYVSGYVLDDLNNPVSGAKVTIGEQNFVTRDDGIFFIDRLNPGQYEVTATLNEQRSTTSLHLNADEYSEIVLTFPTQFEPGLGVPAKILPNVGINTYASERSDGLLAVEVAAERTLGYDIWLIDSQGQKVGEISTSADESNPRWSPNGQKILFQTKQGSEYKVWIYDMQTEETLFIDNGLTPAWLPGSSGVVYSKYVESGNSEIFSWTYESPQPKRLTHEDARDQYPYAATVDGKPLIVFASRRQQKVQKVYDIWAMNIDGSDVRRLSNVGEETGNRMVGPVVNTETSIIAFWEIDYENDHSVWLMNLDGSEQREFIKHAANPEFGRRNRLYFDSKITGRAQIWYTQYR